LFGRAQQNLGNPAAGIFNYNVLVGSSENWRDILHQWYYDDGYASIMENPNHNWIGVGVWFTDTGYVFPEEGGDDKRSVSLNGTFTVVVILASVCHGPASNYSNSLTSCGDVFQEVAEQEFLQECYSDLYNMNPIERSLHMFHPELFPFPLVLHTEARDMWLCSYNNMVPRNPNFAPFYEGVALYEYNFRSAVLKRDLDYQSVFYFTLEHTIPETIFSNQPFYTNPSITDTVGATYSQGWQYSVFKVTNRDITIPALGLFTNGKDYSSSNAFFNVELYSIPVNTMAQPSLRVNWGTIQGAGFLGKGPEQINNDYYNPTAPFTLSPGIYALVGSGHFFSSLSESLYGYGSEACDHGRWEQDHRHLFIHSVETEGFSAFADSLYNSSSVTSVCDSYPNSGGSSLFEYSFVDSFWDDKIRPSLTRTDKVDRDFLGNSNFQYHIFGATEVEIVEDMEGTTSDLSIYNFGWGATKDRKAFTTALLQEHYDILYGNYLVQVNGGFSGELASHISWMPTTVDPRPHKQLWDNPCGFSGVTPNPHVGGLVQCYVDADSGHCTTDHYTWGDNICCSDSFSEARMNIYNSFGQSVFLFASTNWNDVTAADYYRGDEAGEGPAHVIHIGEGASGTQADIDKIYNYVMQGGWATVDLWGMDEEFAQNLLAKIDSTSHFEVESMPTGVPSVITSELYVPEEAHDTFWYEAAKPATVTVGSWDVTTMGRILYCGCEHNTTALLRIDPFDNPALPYMGGSDYACFYEVGHGAVLVSRESLWGNAAFTQPGSANMYLTAFFDNAFKEWPDHRDINFCY